MKSLTCAIAAAALFALGCGDEGGRFRGNPEVVPFAASDPQMNEAVRRAQSTFQFFVDNWQSMPNDGTSLKVRFDTPGGGSEHIWFQPTKIENGMITGWCGNEPDDIPGLSVEDVRTFSSEHVTDWMILVGDKCYGGYTIRVAIEAYPSAAQQFPYEFLDPR